MKKMQLPVLRLFTSLDRVIRSLTRMSGKQRRKVLKEVGIIIGASVGVVAIVVIVGIIRINASYSLDLFEEEGECMSENSFEVFQVTDSGNALAQELVQMHPTPKRTKLIVLFPSEEGQSYYKGQVIEIPLGKCAKQIGVYKYISKSGKKEVPVVGIRGNQ